MAIIREYNRQFGTPTGEVGGRASADAFGGGVAQAAGEFGEQMTNTAVFLDRLAQDREVADAQVKMAEAEVAFSERMTEVRKTAQPGVSTAEQMRAEMGDYFTKMTGNYQHRGAQKYVQVAGMGLTRKYFRDSMEFDIDLNVKDRTAKIGQIDELDKKRVLQDPSAYGEIKARRQAEIDAGVGVWSSPTDDARTKLAVRAINDKSLQDMAFLAGVSSIGIPSVRNSLAGQSSAALNPGRNAMIEGVIKREGGEAIVENDGGRGVTKFGINGVANGLTPEQTRALTKEQATQLYTDRWNKFGVGDLPGNVQNIVFDGVVNHRTEFANQLVNAAKQGATVEQLAQMRTSEYQRLVAADPAKYGQYEKGWMKRVSEVAAAGGAAAPQEPTLPEIKNAPEWYKDLSAENQLKILKMADQQAKQERAVADAALKKTMADHEAYIVRNGQQPPSPLPRSAFTDPLEYESYSAMLAAGSKVSEVAYMTPTAQAAEIEKLRPVMGADEPGVYAMKEKTYDFARKILAAQNEELNADPMGFAYRRKFSMDDPIQPITNFEPNELSQSLAVREPQALSVSQTTSRPLTLLMSSEVNELRARVSSMQGDQAYQYVKTIAGSLSPTAYNSVLQQVFPNNHAYRLAGQLSLTESLTQNGEKASDIAITMMNGAKAMSFSPKGAGASDDRQIKSTLPNPVDVAKVVGEELQGVPLSVNQLAALSEAAMAHYVGKKLERGAAKDMEIGTDGNMSLLKQSIRTVIGTPSRIGTSKVLRPFGVEDSDFQQGVRDRVTAVAPTLRGYDLSLFDGERQLYAVTVGNRPQFIIDFKTPPTRADGTVIPPSTRAVGVRSDRTTQSLMRNPWEQ